MTAFGAGCRLGLQVGIWAPTLPVWPRASCVLSSSYMTVTSPHRPLCALLQQ